MAHKVSDVVFQVTHIPFHLKAYPMARHSCSTTSTAETVFYFNPLAIPLLSSYNLLFLHFDFTGAIRTWNPNKKNSCMSPRPWDTALWSCEGQGWQRQGVWRSWILDPTASCWQKEGDLPLRSPQESILFPYTGKQATLLATINKIS